MDDRLGDVRFLCKLPPYGAGKVGIEVGVKAVRV